VLIKGLRGHALIATKIRVLRLAQHQYPDHFWINWHLASALHALGPLNNEDAIAFFRVAEALRPQSCGAVNSLGQALLSDRIKLPEAIVAFRRANKIDPLDPIVCGNLAFALNTMGKQTGKQDEAISWCHRALELDPKFAHAYNTLGNCFADQGKLDQAMTAYRKAIELDPSDANPLHNLGIACANQGHLDEAITWYRKAIQVNPKHARSYLSLGIDLCEQGKLEQAAAAHRQAIELDPQNARAWYLLGRVLIKQEKVDEAIAAYRLAIDRDPEFANAHQSLGFAFQSQGRLDEAVFEFAKATELDAKLAPSHYQLAWIIITSPGLRSRDLDRALTAANKAVQLEPQNGMYWQGLGYAELRAGNLSAANKALLKLKELGSPGDSLEWFPLSITQWHLGDKDTARQTYEQAVAWMKANNPEDEFLRGLRAEAEKLMGIDSKD
jgi:superkiller protein 3